VPDPELLGEPGLQVHHVPLRSKGQSLGAYGF
jgi:hypothetical protein